MLNTIPLPSTPKLRPAFSLLTALTVLVSAPLVFAETQVGWDAVPAILARIKAPEFPARDFNITDVTVAPVKPE